MSLVAVVGIAYTYVKNEGLIPLPAAFISLSCFLILQPGYLTNEAGESVAVIMKDWCSGQGMIGAIVVGLVVGSVYSLFVHKHIMIKMPDMVPDGIKNTFASLIPGFVLIFGATIVCIIFQNAFGTTFFEWIYRVLQIPLQNLTDTLGGMCIAVFLISFLWWFGIHGAAVVDGVLYGLWTANAMSNQALLDKGLSLTSANGAHIVTAQFYDQFIVVTGSCITIGAVLYMVFCARSQKFKAIGKVGIVPSIFNVNEPILFGTPFVMNPFLFIPMIAVPLIVTIVQYLAISSGLCPMYSGVMVPWTTPIIISGFLVGGWKTALLQVATIAISFGIYFPFMRKVDKLALEEESKAAAIEAGSAE
ncbi:MAG: PTS transporter subunit EIIC [Solobacterium sp.]|jgi:PTS system cellobiose-specific IIC component|nr:PTS transporter subunit EIIC [Solobacterium sp.]MCH4221972.1 PTS transporter subunit EIIC [Solobacterium sp.]MCH4265577.1 PTS transporter subunit EIIC [Solobacterium sp.]